MENKELVGIDINAIVNEIDSPAMKAIAKHIVVSLEGVRQKTLEVEIAKLNIAGCKHLIQIMALERMMRR